MPGWRVDGDFHLVHPFPAGFLITNLTLDGDESAPLAKEVVQINCARIGNETEAMTAQVKNLGLTEQGASLDCSFTSRAIVIAWFLSVARPAEPRALSDQPERMRNDGQNLTGEAARGAERVQLNTDGILCSSRLHLCAEKCPVRIAAAGPFVYWGFEMKFPEVRPIAGQALRVCPRSRRKGPFA